MLTIHRLAQNDFASYGQLSNEMSVRECVVLELPWVGNQHDVSCVPATIDPAGTRVHVPYTAERYFSPDHGYVVFRLTDVPDRGYIELHIGCLPRDSKGCILLGTAFGPVDYGDGRPNGKGDGITASRAAFLAFMAAHPEQRFTLDITDPPESAA